jgi:hypothetical protein
MTYSKIVILLLALSLAVQNTCPERFYRSIVLNPPEKPPRFS